MMNRQGSGFWNSIPAVTKNLIIINILFWLASIVLPKTTGIDVTDWLGLHVPGAHHFNLIQIVSYMFLHDPSGVTHILFNMFAVWMFGRILEYEWGGKRFLIYYLVTGMGAGLVNIMVALIRIHLVERGMDSLAIESVYREGWSALSQGKNFIDPSMGQLNLLLNSTTIGASGAVFGILLAFGIKYPDVPLYIMFIPIPVKTKYVVIGYGLIELFAGFAQFSGDTVAHFAHLGGMLFGFLLLFYWKKTASGHGRPF